MAFVVAVLPAGATAADWTLTNAIAGHSGGLRLTARSDRGRLRLSQRALCGLGVRCCIRGARGSGETSRAAVAAAFATAVPPLPPTRSLSHRLSTAARVRCRRRSRGRRRPRRHDVTSGVNFAADFPSLRLRSRMRSSHQSAFRNAIDTGVAHRPRADHAPAPPADALADDIAWPDPPDLAVLLASALPPAPSPYRPRHRCASHDVAAPLLRRSPCSSRLHRRRFRALQN